MNFKITVELDEGIKKTVVHSLTAECALIYFNDSNKLKEIIGGMVADGAVECSNEILDYFKKHKSTLLQRKKNGVLECLQVKDIDEAKKWYTEGESCKTEGF